MRQGRRVGIGPVDKIWRWQLVHHGGAGGGMWSNGRLCASMADAHPVKRSKPHPAVDSPPT
jgi:hypothetical protein